MPIIQAGEKLELAEIATIGNSVSYKQSAVKALMDDMRSNATNGVKRPRAPKASVAQLESMGIKVEVGSST